MTPLTPTVLPEGLTACLGGHWGCGRRYRCRRYRLDRRRSGRWPRTPLRQIWLPISDEGRGADLGLQAIRRVLHAADQRSEISPLLDEVLATFDHNPSQAAAWSETGDCDRLCRLCDDGAAACDPGDPVGRRIVERVADAIGDLFDMFLRLGIDRLSLIGRAVQGNRGMVDARSAQPPHRSGA